MGAAATETTAAVISTIIGALAHRPTTFSAVVDNCWLSQNSPPGKMATFLTSWPHVLLGVPVARHRVAFAGGQFTVASSYAAKRRTEKGGHCTTSTGTVVTDALSIAVACRARRPLAMLCLSIESPRTLKRGIGHSIRRSNQVPCRPSHTRSMPSYFVHLLCLLNTLVWIVSVRVPYVFRLCPHLARIGAAGAGVTGTDGEKQSGLSSTLTIYSVVAETLQGLVPAPHRLAWLLLRSHPLLPGCHWPVSRQPLRHPLLPSLLPGHRP